MFGNSWCAGDGWGDHFDNIGPEEKCKFSYNCFLMYYSDFISFICMQYFIRLIIDGNGTTIFSMNAPDPIPVIYACCHLQNFNPPL